MKRALAIPVTLVAIALGFLVTLQIQTQKSVSELEKLQEQRTASVKNLLVEAQAENKRLQEEHKKLTQQLDDARKVGGTSPQLLAELDRYRMMEGTVEVQGPGIQITIDDRQQEHKVVFPLTPDDLLRIANTLKFAGAEAISINDQRLVSSTAIVLSGSATKLVNQVPITRAEGIPYEILAIGNQDQLLDYFTKLEASTLKQAGISVSVARKTVRIPSYKGSYSIKKPS
jgi:uncharacterized protein YlxW (UPF0749 family)